MTSFIRLVLHLAFGYIISLALLAAFKVHVEWFGFAICTFFGAELAKVVAVQVGKAWTYGALTAQLEVAAELAKVTTASE